jgi:hypothetical protein
MKKVFYFVMVCLWALGVIGGLGATIYIKTYVCAVGMLGLSWMAWPKLDEYVKKLIG